MRALETRKTETALRQTKDLFEMTTIILTIIGILLAAAAALMVIFYGGDAFNSGSTGAAANTLQNAGTNVISAVQLYRIEKGNATGATLAVLIKDDCSTGGACLKEQPSIPQTIPTTASEQTLVDTLYKITNVAAPVCVRINANLKITTPVTAVDTRKMGCAQASADAVGTFYANA